MSNTPRILVIDNYDSFTWNLVHYVGETGASVEVVRNDERSLDDLVESAPDGVLLSPGPGAPKSAGVTLSAIARFAGQVPILGVCLGHQAIGQAFGGRVVRSVEIVHGKKTEIALGRSTLFAGLQKKLTVGRYHSLVVDRASLPEVLVATALSPKGEIMGLRHRRLDIEGFQFHPESILTESGRHLISNWTKLCVARRAQWHSRSSMRATRRKS